MLLSSLDRLLVHLARLSGVNEDKTNALRARAKALLLLPRYRYRRKLRLINDALSGTDLASRYWITFGLLLGWARDRRPIPWDFRDADFAYAAGDRDLFLTQAQPALLAAGFELMKEWRNNAGTITERTFYKDKVRFDFFEMYEDSEGPYYYSYGKRGGRWCEMTCRLPRHGVAMIDYLGRTWLKPDDHEEYLKRIYGDWRVPRPDYDYAEDDSNVTDAYAHEGV